MGPTSKISLQVISLEHLPKSVKRLYLAYSSGIDSNVLLHLLLSYRPQFEVIIWHINHGLQDNAQQMEDFAHQQADLYQIPIQVDSLSLKSNLSNLEARARQQRYSLFEKGLTDEDALLTAHHMNDQAETLIMNLMRGSGPTGLSAIAEIKPLGQGVLFRPLLNYSRLQVEQYAADHQLTCIEDQSNSNTHYDRNYLRHNVLPILKQRWPAVIKQLHRVSEIQNETAQLLIELAQLDFQSVLCTKPFSEFGCLSISGLNSLSVERKKNLLRYWCKQNGFNHPGYHKLEEIISQMDSRTDAMPIIDCGSYSIRMFKQYLYLVENRTLNLETIYHFPDSGMLVIEEINLSTSRSEVLGFLNKKDEEQELILCFKSINGNCMPGSGHRLKRLFQKYQIPPWLRTQIPQVVIDNELIDLWLSQYKL